MQLDPRKYLWDALHAVELVHGFARGQSFVDDALVWQLLTDKLPGLRQALEEQIDHD
jgi:uncharacterized protein with HEPN domain